MKSMDHRLLSLVVIALSTPAWGWEPAPAFPDAGQARAFAAGVNRNGTIFVIGGRPLGTSGAKDTPIHYLSPGAASWTVGVFAEGRVVRQGAGVDALGRIIVFGGVDGLDPEGDLGAAYVYDLIEGQYQGIADRGAAAPPEYFAWATDAQNRIYSLGGGAGALAGPGQPNSAYAERYVGTTDTWEPIAPLPFPVADAAAVDDGRGHILVLGGYDQFATTRLATVLQYDIATGTWSGLAVPDMPGALAGHRAVLGANERVYVLGGESGPVGAGTTVNSSYVLHLDTNTWSVGPSMLTPRRHFAAVRGDDDYIYAMGGQNDAGGTYLTEKLYTPPCPTITVGPESLATWRGTIAGFSVAATGGLPLTYQWRLDGLDLVDGPTGTGSVISGATTTTLTISGPDDNDAGTYDVVVTNACGATTSPGANLTIQIPPVIPTQWSVVSIHPAWAQMSSYARGIGGGRIGGEATTPTVLPDGRTFNLAHPIVWDADTLVDTDVTPPGSVGGGINDVEGNLLVGWFWHTWDCWGGGQRWTCAWKSAGFWTAPSMVFAEAVHSSGADYDYVSGTDGVHMAGTLVYDGSGGSHIAKAYMWAATNNGNTLHVSGATGSGAAAIDGDRQYGWYRPSTSSTHAVNWTGTSASYVDLHPTGYATSMISGAGDGQAVGTADSNAGLWVNTADAFVDLNPAGAASSSAVTAHQGLQAGSAFSSAALWAGTPESYFDLGAFVPAGFSSSAAEDFEMAPDGTVTVVGYGFNTLTGRNEALVWLSGGIAGDCDGDGDVDLVECQDLAACLSGPGGGLGVNCACLDMEADNDVDLDDFASFQRVFTGTR
ncbi:MAG: kelch repeat-containing protein [Phycisphaerae bacterium]